MPQDPITGRFLSAPWLSLIPTPCATCGKIFSARRAVVKAGYGKYCGKECSGIARRRRVVVPCGICSKPLERKECEVGSGRQNFCGMACRDLGLAAKRLPPTRRLWRHVDKTEYCWLWTGTTDAHGYGYMSGPATGSSPVAVYRVAWEEATGEPVPDGIDVLHVCDNPLCVRNDDVGTYELRGVLLPRRGHLFLGTQTDNVRDMHDKGRARPGGRIPKSAQH